MPSATDAVWIDVLPAMNKFGPAMQKQATPAAAAAGTKAGVSFGKAVLAGVAVVAGGAALATKALYEVGQTFDGMTDTIQTGTGTTGKALDGLVESAKTVGSSIPADFEQVGEAISSLNTLTGATGEALEGMTEQVLEASRMLGEDGVANAEAFGQTMQQWQVPADEGADKLDALYTATQDYGVGLGEITSHLSEYGSVLQNADFTMEESAALFGQLEAGGLSVSRVMPGLNMAFRNWAGEGKNVKEELDRTVDAIANAGSGTEALKIATEEFGAEGAQRMTTAIRNGTLELDDLSGALSDSDGAIAESAEQTRSFGESWEILKDKILVKVEPIATRVFDAISDGMTWISENGIPALQDFGDWIQRNSAWLAPLAAAIGGVAAAVGVWQGALLAYSGVQKAVTAVTAAWNAVLAANPIGLVVVAIAGLVAALVVAYKNSETFRNIVQAAWQGVQAVVSAVVGWFTDTAWPLLKGVYDNLASAVMSLWNDVIKPAWDGIRLAVAVAVEAIKLYWENILKPVFNAYATVLKWLWNEVVAPIFGWIGDNWRGLVDGIAAYWNTVLKPVWETVASVARWLWNEVLSPIFGWIGNRWEGLIGGMKVVYETVLKPMFDAFAGAVGDVRDGVRDAVGGIGRAWEAIKQAFARPVNWVIDNVINKFLGWINDIADDIGVDISFNLVDNVSAGGGGRWGGGVWRGANKGGRIGDGLGPDRDTIPTMLTSGEYVFSRSAVNAIGPDNLDSLHQAARKGQTLEIGAGLGWISDVATAALNKARETIVDVARPGFDAAMGLMDSTVGQWGAAGQFAAGTARTLGDSLLDWMAGIEEEADRRTPELGSGVGWKAMWQAVQNAFPGAQLHSGLRPGAITATGNPSYHGMGRAVDLTPSMDIFEWLRSNYGDSPEIIFSPAGGRQIWNGRNHFYGQPTRGDHWDHVHWAYDQGGMLPPGVSTVANWTGKPERVLNEQQWQSLTGGGLSETVTLVDSDGTFIARMRTEADGVARSHRAASARGRRMREGAV